LTQTIRLVGESPFVEFKFNIGSIPIDDHVGKEIISRFTTNIDSYQTSYTDSNGREMQQRIRNYRATWPYQVNQPVSGNFYPVNAVAYIRDSQRQMTILNDRSQGGASITDGELEIMVHRRTVRDDSRGVGEPMNETQSITPYPEAIRLGPGLGICGTHYLLFGNASRASSQFRPKQAKIFAAPLITFSPMSVGSQAVSTFVSQYSTTRSFSKTPLPNNVELMTLQAQGDGSVILRLSHQFGVGEDPDLSAPVTVDLGGLFTPLTITSAVELSLTANQEKSSLKRPDYLFKGESQGPGQRGESTKYVNHDDGTISVMVTLGPLEIKTFKVIFG